MSSTTVITAQAPEPEESCSDQVEQSGIVGRRKSKNSKNDRKLSPQELFNQISRTIAGAMEHQFLTYRSVVPKTGSLVAGSLDEDGGVERVGHRISYNSHTQTLDVNIMPTFIHDCHQPWLENEKIRMIATGFITFAEAPLLEILCRTSFRTFGPPYISSSKQPDQCILPAGQDLPTVVVETGWTESWPRLRQDMRLWLKGGAGAVELVLLFKWSKLGNPPNRVKGCVEVYNLDPAGNEALIQTETIFPIPAPAATAATQVITITRGQLFGSAIPAGRNPNDTFSLSLNALRPIATRFIQREGFVTA